MRARMIQIGRRASRRSAFGVRRAGFVVALLSAVVLLTAGNARAATSLSQFGITWTFDADYTTGQFANGDYWVVGPVTIIAINPPSTVVSGRVINGSMLNPMPTWGSVQGFDSAVNGIPYSASLNVARPGGNDLSASNPLVLQPGSSLVSCISIDDPSSSNLKLQTAAVLTVLSSPPPAGSFRPAYCGTDKTVKHNVSSLNYSLLGNLPITSQIHNLFPSFNYPYNSILEYLSVVERYFERPWLDHISGWGGQYIHPQDNMPGYGNDIASQVSTGALMLHLDFTNAQKQELLINFIQVGIDLYGAAANGTTWPPDGGHASGRKWPILFAGIMLNDADMKNIGQKSGDYLDSPGYGPGNPPPDYISFGEDAQTFYVSQFDVDLQHAGDRIPYEQADIGLPEWGIRHATVPIYDDKDWDARYRGMHNVNTWGGFLLAAHVMEPATSARTLWNHMALFHYIDRDAEVRGLSDRHFVSLVWSIYRAGFGNVWTSTPSSPDNNTPALAAIGDKTVDEGSLLTFDVSATDADGDLLTYSIQNPPSGASFTDRTFTWTPAYDQAGSYSVTFVVSDPDGAQDSETITITVNNVNRSPELQSIGNKSVNENDTLSFTVSATDPDGDTITYSVDPLPSGAALSGATFTWTPSYAQAGGYSLTFTASDGQAQDSETITVTVNNVNRSPVLDAIADQTIYTGNLLSFAVSATDPDGDSVQYSASGLPTGSEFSGSTFSWTPTVGQTGTYSVTFTASDGQLSDSVTVDITVTGDNTAPQVTSPSPADGDVQVPLNNLVVLHVVDDGIGVDANSVNISINGTIVYTGGGTEYDSASGHCVRTGTAADYRFVYESNQAFDFDQTITVAVTAADLAGNTLSNYTYQFTTEMLSFGENKQIASDGLGKANPVTVRDSSGNVWAAWQAGTAGSRDIYIARMAADTGTFDDPVRMTTDPADQHNPALAIDGDDKLYLLWQDNRRGNWDIYIRTSADGSTWSGETRITDSNDDDVNPAIAVDNSTPTPTAYVTWQSDRTGNQDIFVASSNNDFLTSTVRQVTTDSHDQLEPAITADSAGVVYVVWTDQRNGSKDIYGAASNYGPWQNVPVVTKQADQSSPAIAAEQTGAMLHVVWVDEIAGNRDIYYATSDGLPSSALTGTNIVDDQTAADQSAPSIIVAGSTGNDLKVYACWTDNRNAATTADSDLYFVRIGSDENVFVGDDGTNSDQAQPTIGIDATGHPYLLWADSRGTTQDIYYAGATFPSSSPLASMEISSAAGATIGPAQVSDTDDASVVVPEGACPYPVTIRISKVQNPPKVTLERFSLPFEFSPSGLQFSEPVTVTIPYTVSGDGQLVSAYWYDPLTGTLSQQGITNVQTIQVTSDLYALRFDTTHFTQFFVGSAGAASSGGGGGGGGGCAVVGYADNGSVAEFLLPYGLVAATMIFVKLRDKGKRKAIKSNRNGS